MNDNVALPNLIVIGAQRCGTTALHSYLDAHPEIAMSRPKELNFFLDAPVPVAPGCSLTSDEVTIVSRTQRNWFKGADWYASHFSSRARIRGEASPDYTAPWYPDAAAKMAATVPYAKLIFLVRDPVERAISHYLNLAAVGREERSLAAALSDTTGMYVARGRYATVLEPYLRVFAAENILVAAQEDLFEHRRKTLGKIYRFAEVDASFWSADLERERNRSSARPRINWVERLVDASKVRQRFVSRIPSGAKWRIERGLLSLRGPAGRPELDSGVRAELVDSLREDVFRLRHLTGQDFPSWSL